MKLRNVVDALMLLLAATVLMRSVAALQHEREWSWEVA
jgi:hypothetical protein